MPGVLRREIRGKVRGIVECVTAEIDHRKQRPRRIGSAVVDISRMHVSGVSRDLKRIGQDVG